MELAELIANPVVHVQGVDYNLDIVCGSDYKVYTCTCACMCMKIQLLYNSLWLSVSTAYDGAKQCHIHLRTYSCLWCSVGKDDRYVTTCIYTKNLLHVNKHIHMYTYMYIHLPVSHILRWNLSIAEEVYTSPPLCGKARTLAALNSCAGLSQPKRHLGNKNPPILSLEPSSLVLDELHLLLRIGDVLLRNVILQADSLDHQVYMREGRQSENHL